MEHLDDAPQPVELSPQLVTILTTEHYTLQTGRSMTISEANGRSSLFVGAVSSGLVALAFVGQLAQLGTAFFVFGLVVLPTLLLMGLITFERVLQTGVADYVYALGIDNIRRLYLEAAPQLRPHLMFVTPARPTRTYTHPEEHISWWQTFLTTAGMVAVINSVLAGSFVGLLLAALALPLWVGTAAGVAAFLVSLGSQQRYQWRQWMKALRQQQGSATGNPKQADGS